MPARAGRRAVPAAALPAPLDDAGLCLGSPCGRDALRLVRGDALQRHPRAAHMGHHGPPVRDRRDPAGARRAAPRTVVGARRLARGPAVHAALGRALRPPRGLGLQRTSAAEAAAITPTLMPVLAGLFARALLREEQGRTRWLGYGAIVAGLVCLVTADAAAHGAPSPAGLCALALAAAM